MTTSLRTYGACENCGQGIHTDADVKRGWIHTGTGNYSCPSGGFAGPLSAETMEARVEESFDYGHEEGYDVGYDNGYEEGQLRQFDATIKALEGLPDNQTNLADIRRVIEAMEP